VPNANCSSKESKRSWNPEKIRPLNYGSGDGSAKEALGETSRAGGPGVAELRLSAEVFGTDFG
jgi:hypothetical protein